MKIAIINNCSPFVRGGAELLAEGLRDKLLEAGHRATLIRVPFRWEPPVAILRSLLTCRLLRISNADRVVALKFPVYCVDHSHKRVWLLHQFRQAYDLWGTPLQGIPNTAEGLAVRNAVIRADNLWLRSAERIYTNSPITRERLMRFNSIEAEVLYPPLPSSELLRCEEYGDFVFYPSRMNAAKRQLLAVQAMKYVTTGARLVLAGPPDNSTDLLQIERTIQELDVTKRVVVYGRFISEQEKAEMMNRSLACVYVPYQEDSYGFVSLEAYHARKPVITCTDSGGVRVLVREEETGRVVPPEPRALAAAIDRFYLRRDEARAMGEAGWSLVQSLDISWERVIGVLTE